MPIKKDSEYTKNTLRPNPHTADPDRGDHAFLQEVINVGHFSRPNDGSADSWGASASVVNGLAKTGIKPGSLGLEDEVTREPHNGGAPYVRRPVR